MNTENVTLSAWQGLSTQILECLNGQDGRLWLHFLKRVLRKENPFDPRAWPEMAIIRTGGLFGSKHELRGKFINSRGVSILTGDLKYIFNQLEPQVTENLFSLYKIPIKFFGVEAMSSTTEINSAIIKSDFQLLTPEIAFSAFSQVAFYGFCHCAMAPINFPDGSARTMSIHKSGIGTHNSIITPDINKDILVVKKFILT